MALIDGKCVPTARESELTKRRGSRVDKPPAPSPRHRGRASREARDPQPRRKKGDKSKNGKQVTVVVMYTLRREGGLLLGPLNRTVYASFGPKKHAFEYARREAERRGFGPRTDRTVQLLTDGDPDLHRCVDEYFGADEFPNRVVTVDVIHVLEKLWDAGRARHKEGSAALAAWVHIQEDRLYADDAADVVDELRRWMDETPKTGPGNKGRRKRLEDAIRYLENEPVRQAGLRHLPRARPRGRHRPGRRGRQVRRRQALRPRRHALGARTRSGGHPAPMRRRERPLERLRDLGPRPPSERRTGYRQSSAASDEHPGKPTISPSCRVTEADLHPEE